MFAVAVIYWLVVMLTEHGAAVTPDSAGYVRSWEVYADGTLDLVRTPGYQAYPAVLLLGGNVVTIVLHRRRG